MADVEPTDAQVISQHIAKNQPAYSFWSDDYAISDFGKLGEKDPFFKELDACCKAHKGLWNAEAEKLIFKHFGVTVDTFD